MDGINPEQVTAWFKEHVPGVATPLRFSLVSGGKSNLTYRVETADGKAYVLRRPPMGHVLETAHDMGREHRIITALYGKGVPVAKTHGLNRDKAINDAPFYVMDFVEGVVLQDEAAARSIDSADRQALGEHIIDVLATLHMVNPDAVGLGDLGRKEAYIPRQLKRWTKQYEDSKTDDIPEMDECRRRLERDMPEQIGSAIVHGDYRPRNLMGAGPRVAAVLDWELCTLGDPLADVGYLMNSWSDPGDALAESPTSIGGFPSRPEIAARYTKHTGRDLAQINYYRAFSHWRLAAIGQGVYKRFLMGVMGQQDMDLESYRQSVVTRAQKALELLTA